MVHGIGVDNSIHTFESVLRGPFSDTNNKARVELIFQADDYIVSSMAVITLCLILDPTHATDYCKQ